MEAVEEYLTDLCKSGCDYDGKITVAVDVPFSIKDGWLCLKNDRSNLALKNERNPFTENYLIIDLLRAIDSNFDVKDVTVLNAKADIITNK